MSTMAIVRDPVAQRGDLIIREGPFTIAERDAIPEDGYRHELLDGVLVMSPTPRPRHQDVVLSLGALLKQHAPRELKVMCAPTDVVLGERTVVEPDVLVVRRSDVGPERIDAVPVLAVEVASPSTRLIDLGRKKDVLAEAGCPSYWTIEPEGPELTVWSLRDGGYVEVARVLGDESWTAEAPFPVTITPSALLDD
jgi:Uma2 family endonuclease